MANRIVHILGSVWTIRDWTVREIVVEREQNGTLANMETYMPRIRDEIFFGITKTDSITWTNTAMPIQLKVSPTGCHCRKCRRRMAMLKSAYCPLCDKDFTLDADQNTIHCPECGHHLNLKTPYQVMEDFVASPQFIDRLEKAVADYQSSLERGAQAVFKMANKKTIETNGNQ